MKHGDGDVTISGDPLNLWTITYYLPPSVGQLKVSQSTSYLVINQRRFTKQDHLN